ncbi:transposase [Lactiplantibacillus pentosus KCA1]|nr:helix-turn-helix domain-containing protein [Lactiplantibacillus pentosus]EIW14407.1 transposase [Lactiplantibacillus pentosus KCA1]
MSANAIEREYGVKRDQVVQWGERFNTGGIDSLRRRAKRTYTPELMLEVVQ